MRTFFILFIVFLLGTSIVYSTTTTTKIWTEQWGTANEDRGRDVAIDDSGNIYVTGYTAVQFNYNTIV